MRETSTKYESTSTLTKDTVAPAYEGTSQQSVHTKRHVATIIIFGGAVMAWNFRILFGLDLCSVLSSQRDETPVISSTIAARDSLGFFDDIPDYLWNERKEVTNARRRQRQSLLQTMASINHDRIIQSSPSLFYTANWHPDFSCLNEDMMVVPGQLYDSANSGGHKWICDPRRLARVHHARIAQGQEGCLIYSIGIAGSNKKKKKREQFFAFEAAVGEALPMCEVHTFDFRDFSHSEELPAAGVINMTVHAWGLKPSYRIAPLRQNESGGLRAQFDTRPWEMPEFQHRFKTLQEMAEELGHTGRVVDVLKMDCDGCEWYGYKDWLSGVLDIRQLIVETHETPSNANDFFNDLYDANYVMFHKETTMDGTCVEFSFLKMNDSFFNVSFVNDTSLHT